jgi:uncharacterized protein involved in cysteine biosynthesis
MGHVIAALVKAMGQLFDPAVLRVLAKSLGITLAVFAGAGLVLFFALRAAFAALGWDTGGYWSGFAGATAAVLIAIIGFWFLFRVVALAVLQFFADEIVAAVEARHYPQAAKTASNLPFREDLRQSLRGIARTLGYNALAAPVALALGFTGIGPVLVFLAVNAALLGRELTDMALLRHLQPNQGTNPAPASHRLALGTAVAGMMAIPGLGLLAPVIGAAAGTHVAHRSMRLHREMTGGQDA